jgi:hypothetical protein
MRTSWSLPVVAVAILLVAGLPPVAAQEEEPAPVAFVTGAVTKQVDHIEVVGWDEGAATGPSQLRGYDVLYPAGEGGGSLVEQDVEWSDSRLPAKHWMSFDYHLLMKVPDGSEGGMSIVTSHLLEGDEGTWTGTGRAVEGAGDRYSLYELTGHGAYEGLYALLRGSPGIDAHGPWDRSYEGYVFEGALPTFPDRPAPVTTEGMQSFPYPGGPDPDAPAEVVLPEGDAADRSPGHVTGEVGDLEIVGMGTETALDDRVRSTGTLGWDQTASDPRVAGRWTASMVLDDLASTFAGSSLNLYSGSVLLENEAGYWSGSLAGYQAAEEPYPGLLQTELAGHGAYEGLSALLYYAGEGGIDTFEGLVFEGEPPPVPEPMEPPAE